MAETYSQYGEQWTNDIKGLRAEIQKTQSGKPQYVVECEVLEGPFKGQKLQYRGLMNPDDLKQTETTIRCMEALGCADIANDPFGPNRFRGLGKTARGVIAKQDDGKGNIRPVILFANSTALVRPGSEASDADNKAWRDQFGGAIKAIKDKRASAATSGGSDSQDPEF